MNYVRNLDFNHLNLNAREICKKAYLVKFQKTKRKQSSKRALYSF